MTELDRIAREMRRLGISDLLTFTHAGGGSLAVIQDPSNPAQTVSRSLRRFRKTIAAIPAPSTAQIVWEALAGPKGDP